MAYDAKVVCVMIASPGDLVRERAIVREVLARWNSVHSPERAVVLMPLGWEVDSSPELGSRPQEFINQRLLKHADLLVGLFWTRLGTPTGVDISGTVEEIKRHHEAGKPVMLYFSDAPINPRKIDQGQYAALSEFRAWAQQNGLVETYESEEGFEKKFGHQIGIAIRDNDYLKAILNEAPVSDIARLFEAALEAPAKAISARGVELLTLASHDGELLALQTFGGVQFQAGGKVISPQNPRERALWKAAFDELVDEGLIEGRGQVFAVTAKGYKFLDALEPQQS